MPNYSTSLRNAKLAANSAEIGNAGRLQLYAGAKPATGGAAGTPLINPFTLGTPFAPAPTNGVQSPTLPAATTGTANGTAGWGRVTKADGTFVMDLTVGLDGSNADVILNTLTISTGVQVAVTAWTITGGNA